MKKKTLLLPTSRQYGLLDELGARAVSIATAPTQRLAGVTYYDYYGSRSGLYFTREVTMLGLRLHYFRHQGVIEKARLNDLAALESIEFVDLDSPLDGGATSLKLTLEPEFAGFSLSVASSTFRAIGVCASQRPKLDKLPDFLTYGGWDEQTFRSRRDDGQTQFVVVEEVVAAFAQTLTRALDELETGGRRSRLNAPEIKVHECLVDAFAGFQDQPQEPAATDAQLAYSDYMYKILPLAHGGSSNRRF